MVRVPLRKSMESPHFEVHFATELEAQEGVRHDAGPWVERNLDLRTFHPHLRSCSLISRRTSLTIWTVVPRSHGWGGEKGRGAKDQEYKGIH